MSERSNEHPVQETLRVTMDEIRGMVDANTIIGKPINCENGTTVKPRSMKYREIVEVSAKFRRQPRVQKATVFNGF